MIKGRVQKKYKSVVFDQFLYIYIYFLGGGGTVGQLWGSLNNNLFAIKGKKWSKIDDISHKVNKYKNGHIFEPSTERVQAYMPTLYCTVL